MNIYVGIAIGMAGGLLMAARFPNMKMMIWLRSLLGNDPWPPQPPGEILKKQR